MKIKAVYNETFRNVYSITLLLIHCYDSCAVNCKQFNQMSISLNALCALKSSLHKSIQSHDERMYRSGTRKNIASAIAHRAKDSSLWGALKCVNERNGFVPRYQRIFNIVDDRIFCWTVVLRPKRIWKIRKKLSTKATRFFTNKEKFEHEKIRSKISDSQLY